jgi:hypothetical protein
MKRLFNLYALDQNYKIIKPQKIWYFLKALCKEKLMRILFIYICLFYGFIMSLTTHAFTTESRQHINTIIHADETDEYLEGDEQSSLKAILAEFTAKGGTVVRLDKRATSYQLAHGDMVFPACSGGNNRSQTLWNVLRPYTNKITLMPPHSTRYGFDPYNGRSNLRRSKHPHKNAHKNDKFILWAGVSKCKKIGWDVFAKWVSDETITPETLPTMLDYYNSHYYNPNCPSGTRRVYITFTKNAHIHLYRLVQTNTSLENVVVLFFPVEDLIHHPLPEWNTQPYSVKCYSKLAEMLKSHLDFSQLETTTF